MKTKPIKPNFPETIGIHSCSFVAHLKKQSQFSKAYIDVTSVTANGYVTKAPLRSEKTKPIKLVLSNVEWSQFYILHRKTGV